MILCYKKSDKSQHYTEPISIRDHHVWFVVHVQTMKFIPRNLPLYGLMLTDEQFDERFYVPEN